MSLMKHLWRYQSRLAAPQSGHEFAARGTENKTVCHLPRLRRIFRRNVPLALKLAQNRAQGNSAVVLDRLSGARVHADVNQGKPRALAVRFHGDDVLIALSAHLQFDRVT